MSRASNRSMSKSGWKRQDKKYRLEQNAKAKANRDRRANHEKLVARDRIVAEGTDELGEWVAVSTDN